MAVFGIGIAAVYSCVESKDPVLVRSLIPIGPFTVLDDDIDDDNDKLLANAINNNCWHKPSVQYNDTEIDHLIKVNKLQNIFPHSCFFIIA